LDLVCFELVLVCALKFVRATCSSGGCSHRGPELAALAPGQATRVGGRALGARPVLGLARLACVLAVARLRLGCSGRNACGRSPRATVPRCRCRPARCSSAALPHLCYRLRTAAATPLGRSRVSLSALPAVPSMSCSVTQLSHWVNVCGKSVAARARHATPPPARIRLGVAPVRAFLTASTPSRQRR
jgi:hypothetical protein